ncbi:MAG: hypothetical protein ACJ8NS_04810 [Chthoniobacterales bacterium]
MVPIYNITSALQIIVHNQYEGRWEQLHSTHWNGYPSRHLGLTAPELAALPQETRDAYEDAVYDGYRIGRGYGVLWFVTMGFSVLLLLSSILGLLSVRRLRHRLTKRWSERLAAMESKI